MKKFLTLAFILFSCTFIFSQQAVLKEIEQAQRNGANFSKTGLLQFETNDIQSRNQKLEGLKHGIILKPDQTNIAKLLNSQDELVSLSIPTSPGTQISLLLKKNEIFTPDFKLFTSDDAQHPVDYTPGLHYKGIVEGDPKSLVAISIFPEHIMAMITSSEGNFIIGQIKDDPEKRHVYYNDRHLDSMSNFGCSTEDDGLGYTFDQLEPTINSRDVNDCVRIHIEINHDIVNVKGGAAPAADYITGIFNQSFVLYANEQLTLTISEILAWTSTSPYSGSNSSAMLNSFKANTEFFNGDLSHLVSYDSIYGGIAAGFAGICNPNPDLSKCFSGIRNEYTAIPVFSWPVQLVTHEMGHLLGSRHTHACVWNGNNTAIDGCSVPEGGCPQAPPPSGGGTIMSYCTPGRGYYIDFNEGFGPQPGNVIRNMVNASGNCLSQCGELSDYCISNGANSSNEFINKIVLGNINNTSGNNGGYADFTSHSTTLIAGNTYTITLTPKFTGGNKIKSWRIWIDYNNDLDWYDTNELVAQGSGNNTINLTFTVPLNITSTTTRMRVSMKYTGFPAFCETFPFGEVEDYTIVIAAGSETCSDGIQNQNESGVDCGGPCPACSTCNDGIQNQNETGIDCGGPCPACPTCNDGIQNQNETGIDCGGVCPACNEENSSVLLASYFETGWDGWIDGGSDVDRVNSSNSWEGSYSIRIADNSGTQSAMTSPSFNLLSAAGVVINFHFYAKSMETGDDFWVRYNDGSGNWITVATFISGTHFVNNQFYEANVTIPDFIPTSAGSFRIQCDAGEKNDQVFIDAVTITELNGTELIESGISIQKLNKANSEDIEPEDVILMVYPNPVHEVLHISFNGEMQSVRLISLEGTELKVSADAVEEKQIDVHHLASGLYFLLVQSGDKWYPVKFSIVK